MSLLLVRFRGTEAIGDDIAAARMATSISSVSLRDIGISISCIAVILLSLITKFTVFKKRQKVQNLIRDAGIILTSYLLLEFFILMLLERLFQPEKYLTLLK